MNQPTIMTQSRVPEDVLSLFLSPLVSRKRRISLLVKWFQRNYYLWQTDTDGSNKPAKPATFLSNAKFARGLTDALKPYEIEIQTQRVWTWLAERNKPQPDNLQVMLKVAKKDSWQREFAKITLEILKQEKPSE